MTELIFAYIGGLLTLINPCVLPVLPIVLAGSLHKDKRAPAFLALGMSVSFVTLGLVVSALGPALGVNSDTVARVAAMAMVFFGAVMLMPSLSMRFTAATAGMAARADAQLDRQADTGLRGQFLSGMLLGAVWSPCIGPTLGAAIALASTGENLTWAGAIMIAFAAGVSTLILGIAYGARGRIQKHQAKLRGLAEKSKPVMGATFVVVGLGLWFGVHHVIDAWFLQNLPDWLVDLSVKY